MKKHLLLTLSICFFTLLSFGQKVLSVDFTQIKARIENKQSSFYYPSLMQRFEKGDTTFSDDECAALYYGASFQKGYNPYAIVSPRFMELFKAKEFGKALPLGLAQLRKDPVNAELTFKIVACFHEIDLKDSATLYAHRYFTLLKAIYNSGEGTGVENAMVVIHVADEYEILGDSQLSITKQVLVGNTDILELDETSKAKAKIDALYFNVEVPFGYLNKKMKSKR